MGRFGFLYVTATGRSLVYGHNYYGGGAYEDKKSLIEEKPNGGNPHANPQQTNPKQNPTNNKKHPQQESYPKKTT
ncbi:Protein of unknown function [Bacillus mycoides]|nr:Protein of unknown function [Bacillus mycoides]